jgi:hypothetical protein
VRIAASEEHRQIETSPGMGFEGLIIYTAGSSKKRKGDGTDDSASV